MVKGPLLKFEKISGTKVEDNHFLKHNNSEAHKINLKKLINFASQMNCESKSLNDFSLATKKTENDRMIRAI